MELSASPFISVIIATINRTHYLEKCIKAILANNYDEYEIIIVDQGEDNQTKELIDGQFSANERIRPFTNFTGRNRELKEIETLMG